MAVESGERCTYYNKGKLEKWLKILKHCAKWYGRIAERLAELILRGIALGYNKDS